MPRLIRVCVACKSFCCGAFSAVFGARNYDQFWTWFN